MPSAAASRVAITTDLLVGSSTRTTRAHASTLEARRKSCAFDSASPSPTQSEKGPTAERKMPDTDIGRDQEPSPSELIARKQRITGGFMKAADRPPRADLTRTPRGRAATRLMGRTTVRL